MKRTRTTRPSGLPDVVEATKAIRYIVKAMKQDVSIRRFPSMDNDYASVLSRITAALIQHQRGLKELQHAAESPSGTSDVETRMALQHAILELIKAAQLLGEAL